MTLNDLPHQVLLRLADWLRADLGGGGGGGGSGGGGGGGGGCGGGGGGGGGGARPAPPVILVHGVFGAGKSHLLVAMLWFLQRALRGASRHGRPCKVLLAALTNVAVDNVVEGLLRQAEADGEAEPDVVRVGSVRRIAAAVLPHSTHGKLSATEEQSTKRELTRELSTAPAAEQHALKQAIALIDSGRMAARARALHQFTVVGATCAATGLACMQGLKFDFVLLDECSQLTEPASLLPLYRLGCERLIAVGDPMQLPPTLATPPPGFAAAYAANAAAAFAAHSSTSRAGGAPAAAPGPAAGGAGLSLTLFERLARCGLEPVMLRAQYRCHPTISALASHLFYGGRLVDGLGSATAAAAARAPLLPGLPTVSFQHVANGVEQAQRGGSISNAAEASRVARVLGSLVGCGLEPERLGVVCMYRAQAVAIRTHLEERGLAGAVTVSTVDAFQGAERDVILVSTCLTATCGAPDTAREALRFIGDPRRLNVTLTRARHHLLVFGHADVLQSVPAWAVVLDVAASLPAEFVTGHGVEGILVESSDAEVDAALAGAGDGVGVVAADSAGSAADAFDAAQGARADELQLLMAARREKLTRIELMGTRMHSELAAKMDVGVRVNPMLRNMYLSSNSNADESGGAASSGTEEGAAAAPADGGANTRVVVDLLEAGSESDDGELGGCGPAAAAAAASDGSVASVSSRMGSTRDEVVLADEFDGGEAEQALELLDF